MKFENLPEEECNEPVENFDKQPTIHKSPTLKVSQYDSLPFLRGFNKKNTPIIIFCLFLLIIWLGHNFAYLFRKIIIHDEYVAICMAVRDQARDLPEWFIHHYHHLGIRRFYIMDDGTIPPLSEYPDYGIPASTITHVYFPESERHDKMQHYLYSECQRRFGNQHNWIAYIDADEYLEMISNESLTSFLQSFESNYSIGAVGVQWQMHNSAGLLTRPTSCRKAFTKCIADFETQDNRHIKSIVNTAYFVEAQTPHNFFTSHSTLTVGENGDTVPFAWRHPITRNRIALHHYAVKSKEEFVEKSARGNAMHDEGKKWDFWDHVENLEQVDCPSMAKYEP
jgi:hypothetical protein